MKLKWKSMEIPLVIVTCLTCFAFAEDQLFYEGCKLATHYQCFDGKTCVPKSYICNNNYDCPDRDDEEDCDMKLCRGDFYFLCRNNETCITSSLTCDGIADCPDASDESDSMCDPLKEHEKIFRKPCNPDKEFECEGKICIPKKLVCDGTEHCFDGRDEKPELCQNKNSTCPGFFCTDGKKCLPSHNWVCDGSKDCPDGSDELHCTPQCELSEGNFLCKSEDECISLAKVCDGNDDCLDKSDEGGLCDVKDACDKLGCNGNCQLFPSGAACLCGKGRNYNNVTQKCEDINECLTFGICSQGCVNTDGSYYCTCAKEFRLKSDRRSCVVYGVDPLLLYTTQKHVKSIRIHSKMAKLVAKTRQAIGITYDGQNIYWTEISEGRESIVKFIPETERKESVLTAGLESPEDLAIDWLTGNIYFTDALRSHVAVCTSDGRYCTQLVNMKEMNNPRSIVLHPSESLMFWTDWGLHSHIGVAYMDGSEAKVLIDDVAWPNGLALDWPNGRIYWVDAQIQTIESATITGTDRRKVLAGVVQHPFGLALFEDRLYWSDWETMSIESCDKFTGKNHEILVQGEQIFDVHIYHKAMMPHQKHACMLSESQGKKIFLADPNTRNVVTLVDEHIVSVSSMAYDYLANNLYWVDYVKSTIEVYSLNTKKRAIIEHYVGSDRPTTIALAPLRGEMFVALESYRRCHIDKQSMQGGHDHHHIVEDGLSMTGPIHFAIDEVNETLYWSDGDGKKIESSDFNGLRRTLFAATKKSPGPIAIVSNELYWSSLKSRTLQWRNRHTNRGFKLATIETPPGQSPKSDVISVVAGIPLKTSNHPCTNENGGCSDICLSNGPASRVCICAPGSLFKDDTNTTCISRFVCDFKCKSSNVCIHASQRCNGKPECLDKSDEENCTTDEIKFKCDATEFMCKTGNQCIPAGQRCDQHNNCKDKSDEENCNEKEKIEHCKSHEMRCPSGICIDVTQRCDGINDCDDGFDEREDLCKRVNCPNEFFKCLSGQCIPKEFECNAFIDCKDASDEHSGCKMATCEAPMRPCSNGWCIKANLFCDGHEDCEHGFDEIGCPVVDKLMNETCDDNEFQCTSDSTLCIKNEQVCNNFPDCPKGEDEQDCPNCRNDMFECANQRCILSQWVCDGQDDCDDLSDERNCDKTLTLPRFTGTCSASEFKCLDGSCLSYGKVCDGKVDCSGGDDEGGACAIACKDVNPCKQKCIKTPKGAKCSCYEGFQLSSSGDTQCVDIDECKTNDPCAQECFNTIGSFRCACHDGFILASDKTTCKARGKPSTMLITISDEIRELTRFPKRMDVLVDTNYLEIADIDVNVKKRKLLYTLNGNNELFEMNMDTRDTKHFKVVSNPFKIAHDWISDNTYIVHYDDDQTVEIHVCNMDTKGCAVIKKFGYHDQITAIQIDPVNHFLFFVQLTNAIFIHPTSKIIKMRLDGSDQQILMNETLVTTLALDIDLQRVYFTEYESQSLQVIDYEGQNRKFITRQSRMIRQPSSLSVYENHAYILNRVSSQLTRCKLYGNMECHQTEIMGNTAKRMVINQQSRQKIDANHCDKHPCDIVCIPVDVGFKCLCTNGTSVSPGILCLGKVLNEVNSTSYFWIWFFLIIIILSAIIALVWYRRRSFHGKFNIGMHFKNNSLMRVSTETKSVPFPRTTTSDNFVASSAPEVNKLNKNSYEIVNDDFTYYKSAADLNMESNSTEVNGFSDEETEEMENVDIYNDPHQRLIT
ncbi:CLUMA_CG018156, isoform A [Clunio marinus]|uniref:CLUMA_CG018156, isoform A n=1 Tax=Clunio marinus TaxID=568069 RepID=A0A1J1IZK7_9DIPT|nr:CLUMA_CG018156, isoform A [Clunio marinus]